jgi:hypothetical protein
MKSNISVKDYCHSHYDYYHYVVILSVIADSSVLSHVSFEHFGGMISVDLAK